MTVVVESTYATRTRSAAPRSLARRVESMAVACAALKMRSSRMFELATKNVRSLTVSAGGLRHAVASAAGPVSSHQPSALNVSAVAVLFAT